MFIVCVSPRLCCTPIAVALADGTVALEECSYVRRAPLVRAGPGVNDVTARWWRLYSGRGIVLRGDWGTAMPEGCDGESPLKRAEIQSKERDMLRLLYHR